jgi:hypothetical protein
VLRLPLLLVGIRGLVSLRHLPCSFPATSHATIQHIRCASLIPK